MKLREVLEQITPPPMRAGQLIVSGVTGQPRMMAAFLIVAERFRAELPATLRLYARPGRVAVTSVESTIIVLFSNIGIDEAKAAVIGAAEWILRGHVAETGERDELLTREFGAVLQRPKTWPSVLKKLARG